MQQRRWIFLAAVSLACGALAFAQSVAIPAQPQQVATTPNSSATVTTSTTANSVIENQDTSLVSRQFIGATPGVITPAVYPGIPIFGTDWQVYWSAAEHTYTMNEIDRMKRKFHLGDVLPGNWKTRIRSVVKDPDEVKPNDAPIEIVDWWANAISYREDRVVGRVTVICDYLSPEELCLGLGLAEAKTKTHTSRVSIRVRSLREGVTRGFSIGAGAAGSRITQPGGIGNDAVGVATGGLIGTNRVRVEDYLEFEILCLNDGSIIPPIPPAPPQQVTQVQSLPQQLPPVIQVVRLEIPPIELKVDPVKIDLASLPPLLQPQPPSGVAVAPPPVPASPPTEEACDTSGMPELAVWFEFDSFVIKNEYLPKIRSMIFWLRAHPKCQIEIVGQTCKSGTYQYDAGLGLNRAKAVYNLLLANGGDPEQVVRFTSTGKEFPVSEYDDLNRRATANIFKPAVVSLSEQ